jgi:hypothetical protein
MLPGSYSVDASADQAPGATLPCGTRLTPEEVAAFQAYELQFGQPTIPLNAPTTYCIPIAAHIVRTSSGSGGLSLDRLGQGVADCNTAYINTGMHFVLLSVDYIDDDDYYYNIDTDAEIDALIQENVVANAVNVYFTPNLENEDGGLCGRGSFTTSSPQGVAMNNDCTGLASNPSTFPHELGHYFDLFHTHETAFGAELVDGSNCGSAGDKLCDTPADPGLEEGTNVNSFPSCSYYGSETDGNGDSYNPDTSQLMSYAPKQCRDTFSPSSETKVVATLLVLRPNLLTLGCPPLANAGNDITAECTSPTTTPVQLDGTGSSDPEAASLTYAWFASGVVFDNAALAQPTGQFSMGTTTVRLIVFDGTYNDTDYVDVTVEDTTPPDITCPDDITVECTSYCGVPKAELAAYLASASATDVCDPAVSVTNDAPDCFPEGATLVTFSTQDDDGNPNSCTATVTVEDTTPPEIDVVLDRDVLWPPNHKLVEVCAEVTVTDICDPNPTFTLYSTESDEPDNGNGDGNTTDDIQDDALGTPDTCIKFRSERQGGGDGRKYTVIYQAMDDDGNTAYDTVCVRVPHDQSSGAMASTGFSADGKLLNETFNKVAIIIPSRSGLDATAVDVTRVYLGNTRGVLKPVESRHVDGNADGQPDLAVFFESMAVSFLAEPMGPETEVNGAIGRGQADGLLGVHFVSATGTDYLVENIFGLGAPVPMPVSVTDEPGPFDEGAPTVAAVEATGLSSIHPNPFNPQTTVEFALSSPEHVRIAIYDVRGALVRRLVDQSLGAGEHRAEWNGTDDNGRQAASGIYFVRMMAGRYEQTRKIVMLK